MIFLRERTYLLPYLPILPLAYWQGRHLRKKLPEVAVAKGAKSGTIANFPAELTCWFLGDSIMEGVGAEDQYTGLPYLISEVISARLEQTVHWHIFAKSGYRARDVRTRILTQLPKGEPDYIFISVGSNDIFKMTPLGKFEQEIAFLFDTLRKQLPPARVILMPIPPMERFVTFPSSVRWIFGNLSRRYNRRIRSAARQYGFEVSPNFHPASLIPEHFSPDGVHPGPRGYVFIRNWIMKHLDL